MLRSNLIPGRSCTSRPEPVKSRPPARLRAHCLPPILVNYVKKAVNCSLSCNLMCKQSNLKVMHGAASDDQAPHNLTDVFKTLQLGNVSKAHSHSPLCSCCSSTMLQNLHTLPYCARFLDSTPASVCTCTVLEHTGSDGSVSQEEVVPDGCSSIAQELPADSQTSERSSKLRHL